MYEVLFQYGPVTLKTFDLLLTLGFVAGTLFMIRFIELKKMKLSFLSKHLLYFLLIPLIGGRLFYAFEHISWIQDNPLSLITFWDMNFSRFGILYSFIIALYFLSRREKEDFWAWLDAFVLSGLVALVFIHIGHFFNGSHYGTLTDMPWGIAFDTFNIPFTKPIHPTQLYSSALSFFTVNYLVRFVKRTHLTGMAGNLGFMLYCLGALAIDFFHGSPSNYARINYLVIAALAFIFYIHCSHRKLLS